MKFFTQIIGVMIGAALTVGIEHSAAAESAAGLSPGLPANLSAVASAKEEALASAGVTLRFYQGVTAYIHNPDGKSFEINIDIRDWNLMENGPREVLVKLYDPDGRPVVRQVVADDGIAGDAYLPETGGWDHELWYYTLCYGRGSAPMIRWSSLTEPARLAAVPKRSFTFPVSANKKGIYRLLLCGSRDHVATVSIAPDLKLALAGHPLWLHGHGEMFKRSYVYVPKGTIGLDLGFAEFDQPVTRAFKLTAPDGTVLWAGQAQGGFQRSKVKFEPAGKYDEQLLTMEVADGRGDYMLHLLLNRDDVRPYRGIGGVTALFASDPALAKALQGGAIYHDGQVFWHGFQVRLHDWLKSLKPDDYIIRDSSGNEIKPSEGRSYGWSAKAKVYKGLPETPGFVPLNGGHEPPPLCDSLMHSYAAHKNKNVLNVAVRDLADGLRTITVGDLPVTSSWNGNLGYAFATYGFHYWRPAWRILQQSDAPPELKAIIREAIISGGDRLAFGRGIERVNGNALSHIPMALRYAAEAAQDPLLTDLATTYFDRFVSGGWGRGVGISRSGDCHEHFGHDLLYGTYILANYSAIIADMNEPKFKAVRDRIQALYGYFYCDGVVAAPWGSRTAGGTSIGSENYQGRPGPDFTVSVHGGDEWFAARRKNYYLLTFHGRLAPEWLNNYFATRIGYGGGIICQLTVPGAGPVIASSSSGSYGAGMQRGNWRNFRIHALVGTLADGQPLVAADSEHLDARLEGNTVSSSGEVRDRPIHVSRRYTFQEDRIVAEVQLADTAYRMALDGRGPDSKLNEAYEMIPFVSEKNAPTRVLGLSVGDGPAIEVSAEAQPARGLILDRAGFGVQIEFDKVRPVKLGQNQTVLIQLIDAPAAPNDVSFAYTLIPYLGQGAPETIKPKPQSLPRIAAVDAPAGLTTALGEAPAHEIKIAGKPAATVRLARAGDRLAVVAVITDAKVSRGDPLWKGSCLELFGSLPGEQRIGQVFLAPATDKAAATAAVAAGKDIAPAADILVESQPVPGGYELRALIPLARLALDPGKSTWLLEAQITTHDAKGAVQRGTRFGSERAYEANWSYGAFEVVAP
ncbi:MAG: hypothetical protein HYV35_07640 [Lentisphaerae bacterium]|nr:hypothetical protein [Lentisphaerota bacterium]